MGSYNFPEYRDNPLLERVVKLEKEIRQLRSHNPLNSATQNDADGVARIIFGSKGDAYGVTVMDETGENPIVQLGTFPVTGRQDPRLETGVQVLSAAGDRLFMSTNESGLLQPAQELNFFATGVTSQDPALVAHEQFDAVWVASTRRASADAIETVGFVNAPSGTVGEFRLHLSIGGVSYRTPAIQLDNAGAQFVSRWKPMDSLLGSTFALELEARRVSGIGLVVHAYRPTSRVLSGYHLDATATGDLTY